MDKLLTPAELSAVIGLATQTIYNRHCSGASLPPCVRIGRVIRFPQSGIESWLAAQVESFDSALALRPSRRLGRPTKAEEIARRKGGAI